MYTWKTSLDAKTISRNIRLTYIKCLHYYYSYKDEQSSVNVHWYLYLHEKRPLNHLSPDQKKSYFAKCKKISCCLKIGTPMFKHSMLAPIQPMILALEDTHQQSQLRYSRQESMKPISRRYLKRIRASSIVAIDRFVKKGNTNFPSTRYSIYSLVN